MFEVSFYTAGGVYTVQLSKDCKSWKKAKAEATAILNDPDVNSPVPLPSEIKDVTIWQYKRGRLAECHTWFWDACRR